MGLNQQTEKTQEYKIVRYSPWIVHFNTGACNGCDIEVLATLSPQYDPERFGVKLAPSIRHGDIILVTGALTKKASERLKRLYDQMPCPKFVVAIGACAINGGVFQKSYSVIGSAAKVVPVSMNIPGCPPRPEAILDGIVKLIERIKRGEVDNDGCE